MEEQSEESCLVDHIKALVNELNELSSEVAKHNIAVTYDTIEITNRSDKVQVYLLMVRIAKNL